MINYRITHLFAATAYTSLFAALIPMGELGFSLMPELALPSLFLIPYIFDLNHCPMIFKARYHFAGAFLLLVLLGRRGIAGLLLFEYGWWALPLSAPFILCLVPIAMFITQGMKLDSRGKPKIGWRLIQIGVIWLPFLMGVIAWSFGTLMPLV